MTEAETQALTDFVRARIAEDEAAARKYPELGWDRDRWELGFAFDRGYSEPTDVTIDPARVLAECEAKRLLIERVGNPHWAGFNILALPYADHPDYRQEWKP